MDRSLLDVDRIKDYVDGYELTLEKLYGTIEKIIINGKIFCTSNYDPNFKTDEGMKRRGFMSILTNKFVNEDSYINKNGIYLLDNNFIDNFDNINYKLAFIHLLLPYLP